MLIEAGRPPGMQNVVNGEKEALDAILYDPDIETMGFVGSTPVTAHFYTHATTSGNRAPCFGGAKNQMIVMLVADLDQAVDVIVRQLTGRLAENAWRSRSRCL